MGQRILLLTIGDWILRNEDRNKCSHAKIFSCKNRSSFLRVHCGRCQIRPFNAHFESATRQDLLINRIMPIMKHSATDPDLMTPCKTIKYSKLNSHYRFLDATAKTVRCLWRAFDQSRNYRGSINQSVVSAIVLELFIILGLEECTLHM